MKYLILRAIHVVSLRACASQPARREASRSIYEKMENSVDVDDEEILRSACALPLPPDDGDLERINYGYCGSDFLIFDETTQICATCEIVLESPSYGPLCEACHHFLYPDYTVLQQELDEEKLRQTEQDQHPVCSLSLATLAQRTGSRLVTNVHVNKSVLPSISSASTSELNVEEEFIGLALLSLYDEEFKQQQAVCFTNHDSFIEDDLVERLPTEVLLAIFSYLDEGGMVKATQVSKRWRMLTRNMENWSTWFEKKWPSFRPVGVVMSWMSLYIKMLNSCTCVPCFEQGFVKRIPVDDIPNSWRNKRLRSELKQLLLDPPQGIRACPVDDEYSHWQASIQGPPDSVYENGIFYVHLELPRSYPMRPPLVRFLTRILHPNINRHGNIGMDCLLNNWSLALTIPKVLVSVQSILTDPYCPISMEPIVAKMYVEDRERFNEMAREWTKQYAMLHLQTDSSMSE